MQTKLKIPKEKIKGERIGIIIKYAIKHPNATCEDLMKKFKIDLPRAFYVIIIAAKKLV